MRLLELLPTPTGAAVIWFARDCDCALDQFEEPRAEGVIFTAMGTKRKAHHRQKTFGDESCHRGKDPSTESMLCR